MATSLQNAQKEIKEQIFKDYLNGMEIEDIRKKYGLKFSRSVYFHFPPLTKKHKLTHMGNKIKRMKKEDKNESQETQTSDES